MSNTAYRRVPNHNLDFYIPSGDLITSFVLISPNRSTLRIPQPRSINIRQEHRVADNKWLLTFVLEDPSFDRLFDKFCREVLEKTAELEDITRGPDEVLLEFSEWKNMFSLETINKEDIQGVIGELLFLKDYLIPTYGESKSMKSWTRVNYGKQDFMMDDTWYEVKSTKVGSERVIISSVEQLDNSKQGHLAIVVLQSSTSVSGSSFNLNTLYEQIMSELKEPSSKQMLKNALKKYQIPDERYDELIFEEMGIESYAVSESFPRMKKANIPMGIRIPSYEIMIATIEPFKEQIRWEKQ